MGRLNASDWATFLDGLASLMTMNKPLPESLEMWGSATQGSSGKVAKAVASHLRQGMPLNQSFQMADVSMPLAQRRLIVRAIDRDVFPLWAPIMARRLRESKEHRYRSWSAWIYVGLVMSVAWCGSLILVVNLVPSMQEAFTILSLQPTWWLRLYGVIYASRWIWFTSLPLILLALGLWNVLRRKRVDTPELKGRIRSSGRVTDTIELACAIAETRQMSIAIEISQFVYAVRDSDLLAAGVRVAQWQAHKVSPRTAAKYLQHLVVWNQERDLIRQRFWLETLPFRLSVTVGCTAVAVYVCLGVFPWLWMMSLAMDSVGL